jgi:hypothetical protein
MRLAFSVGSINCLAHTVHLAPLQQLAQAQCCVTKMSLGLGTIPAACVFLAFA